MKRSPMKRRRRTKHQLANVEHREYLAWIHTQPCAACGTRQNIQAAHVGRGGMGMKHGSDAEVIPLCGPRWVPLGIGGAMVNGVEYVTTSHAMVQGCHADHDQLNGHFSVGTNWSSRDAIRQWDATQVVAHRGRFEALHVANEVVPF